MLFDPFVADPPRAGVFTDFDGTLAPIVDDPATSQPVPGAVDTLVRLARQVGRVGVLSGRPVDFLAAWLPSPVDLSGLYGLQRRIDGRRHDRPDASTWGPVVDAAADAARRSGPDGMRVEHKELSLTLHYRERPDLAAAVEAWASTEGAGTGLEVHRARMSVELHPPIPADKGSALLEFAAGLTSVCFLGDDVGDLPAFAALDTLRGEGVATVKVAVHSSEQDPRLARAADLVVDDPPQALALLTDLSARLPPPP